MMGQLGSSGRWLGDGSRALSYTLGSVILLLWLASQIFAMPAAELIGRGVETLGVGFLLVLGGLVHLCLLSCVRMRDPEKRTLWTRIGSHSADGIATIALTCTLLGISLGIASLTERPLEPATINAVIAELSGHFSLAFMTSVIGLPIAALLRALVAVREAALTAAARPAPLAPTLSDLSLDVGKSGDLAGELS